LCGCDTLDKIGYNSDASATDKQGFQVCPEHGDRMYGWRTPLKSGSFGQRVIDYEAFAYGDSRATSRLDLDFESTPDMRDDRDPLEMGIGFIARTNGRIT